MKTVAIIQARLGSTRCPRKVIREIRGKPLIRYVVERVSMANVAEVIVAVPEPDCKEITAAVGWDGPWQVLAPHVSEDDVAGRFATILGMNPCDAFVRICADSPLIDPALIDMAVERFTSGCLNIIRSSNYPHGQQVEVVNTKTFLEVEPKMKGKYREHVTLWFYAPRLPDVNEFWPSKDFSHVRMVVDTEEDFENMKALIGKMDGPHTEYHWREIMELM